MDTTVSRRFVAAGLLLIPTGAYAQTLSTADQALVERARLYLQGLTLARGRFTQLDHRNARSSGEFYLSRPGKVRFEYDPPNEVLIVSDGNQVSVEDRKLGTQQRFALRTTPLAIFLAREIRLAGGQVRSVDRGDGEFSITAANGEGTIRMTFQNEPVKLKGWTVTEKNRQATRVSLTSLNPVASLDPSLFTFRRPRQSGRP